MWDGPLWGSFFMGILFKVVFHRVVFYDPDICKDLYDVDQDDTRFPPSVRFLCWDVPFLGVNLIRKSMLMFMVHYHNTLSNQLPNAPCQKQLQLTLPHICTGKDHKA